MDPESDMRCTRIVNSQKRLEPRTSESPWKIEGHHWPYDAWKRTLFETYIRPLLTWPSSPSSLTPQFVVYFLCMDVLVPCVLAPAVFQFHIRLITFLLFLIHCEQF